MPTAKKSAHHKLMQAAKNYVNGVYIEHIPHYSWVQALRDAGYKESYAMKQCSTLWGSAEQYIDEIQQTVERKQSYDLAWVDSEFRSLYDECRKKGDKTNAKGCLDSLTRRLSGFTDNINAKREEVSSLSEQEQELLQANAREMKLKLADIGSEKATG